MKMVDAAVRNRLFLQAIEEMHAMGGVWSVKDERIYETFRPVWERMMVRLFREADVSAEVMQEFESLSPRGKEDCVAELGWCSLDRLVRLVRGRCVVRAHPADERGSTGTRGRSRSGPVRGSSRH